MLSAILQQEGYHVHESMSVDHAAGVMYHEEVAAVITDLKMPIKEGFPLFIYVSRHHHHWPHIHS